jgi:starvation-inducible DNA-binding protein
MHPTHNTLSENIRAQSVELLNKHLAAAIDLHAQVKQAHWNVRGPSFIAIHELFDKVSSEVEDYSDLIAVRAGGRGGTACGPVHVAAERSFLVPYPLGIADEQEHVFAVSGTLAAFAPIRTRGHRSSGNLRRCRYRRFVHRNLAGHRPSIMVHRIPPRP